VAGSLRKIQNPVQKSRSPGRQAIETSDYDRINKPFIAKIRPIAKNIHEYKTFLSLLRIHSTGIRAKRLNIRTNLF
jgi:hypothetical protein